MVRGYHNTKILSTVLYYYFDFRGKRNASSFHTLRFEYEGVNPSTGLYHKGNAHTDGAANWCRLFELK